MALSTSPAPARLGLRFIHPVLRDFWARRIGVRYRIPRTCSRSGTKALLTVRAGTNGWPLAGTLPA